MRIATAADLNDALDFPSLIERLRNAFRSEISVPVRHHHTIVRPDDEAAAGDATLLLMPAWTTMSPDQPSGGGFIGIKTATVFPGNTWLGKPTVMGVYLLLSGRTGEPVALIDGPTLTLWRTAAASALAASYLARPDSERLLMVGAGSLAPFLIRAHAAVRPICNVLVWNRDMAKAERLAARLNRPDFRVAATDDLEAAARGANVISCATMATEPLLHGDWLPPGVHVDLVGGFRPDMREADDEAIRRARVFVDTREGALAEAGDITQPVASGVLLPEDIAGDLFELSRGDRAGRRYYDQVTLFKSVGTALEDLAAAIMVLERT